MKTAIEQATQAVPDEAEKASKQMALRGRWRVGTKWGRLTVANRWREPVTDDCGVTDSHGPVFLRLACECGADWVTAEKDFHQNRKDIRSCSREECRQAATKGKTVKVKEYKKRGPGRPPSHPGGSVGVQLWLPLVVVKAVDEFAEGVGVTRSQAVKVLLEQALAG